MRYWTFLISLIMLSSCSEFQKPDQLAALDKLELRIDSLQVLCEELQELDLASIQNKRADLISTVGQLQDTIDLNTAVLIDKVLIATGEAVELERQVAFLDSCLELEKNQLHSLRNDIKGALGKRNKYDEYIVFEEDRIDSLFMVADQAASTFNRVNLASEQYYDSLVVELAKYN